MFGLWVRGWGDAAFSMVLRARINVFFIPKKAFTPSQTGGFLLIIIGKECEGLDFQVFTSQASV